MKVPCEAWPSRAPLAASAASNRSSARRRRTSSATSARRSRATASTFPGPDFVDRVMRDSDRPTPVLRSLQSIFSHGRLAGTGYVSILPVDQGIEHSAGASFAKNPDYFDPEGIVKLAVEGGCNAVASTLGVLGAVLAQVRPPHPVRGQAQPQRVPQLPERLRPDHVRPGQAGARDGRRRRRRDDLLRLGGVEAADRRGLAGLRDRARAGPATILWCYLRNSAFNTTKEGGPDYHTAADLTGQANHLGVTIEADIIKQKLPEVVGARLHRPQLRQDRQARLQRADDAAPDRHDPLPAGQLLHGPRGAHQLGRRVRARPTCQDAVKTAVINKRAGGTGPDLGPQGVPEAARRRHRAAQRDPGRLPVAGGHGRVTDPLLASEGWGVIHLYFRLRRRPPRGDRRWPRPRRSSRSSPREAPYQAIWTAPLGDRADLGLMLIGPDLVRLERLPRRAHAQRARPPPRAGARARPRVDDRALRVHEPRGQRGAHGDARAPRAPAPAAPPAALLLPDGEEARGRRQLVLAGATTSAAS